MKKSSVKSKNSKAPNVEQSGLSPIDPEVIRFTHSRIRPFFSGCGRRVMSTLDDILERKLLLDDLPVITVILNDGFYFSLNNRRLFVLKALRKKGFLVSRNNLVNVRIKAPLERESERYTLERCCLQAKLMNMRSVDDVEDVEDHTDANIDVHVDTATNQTKKTDFPSSSAKGVPTVAPYHAHVKSSIRNLQKLISKGKESLVVEQLKEWIKDGILLHQQIPPLLVEIGLEPQTYDSLR